MGHSLPGKKEDHATIGVWHEPPPPQEKMSPPLWGEAYTENHHGFDRPSAKSAKSAPLLPWQRVSYQHLYLWKQATIKNK